LGVQVIENFAFVETVIAAGEHVQTVREKFFGDERGDAEAAGAIFGVGDGEADFVLGDQAVEVIGDNAAAGRGEYVADKKDVHERVKGKEKSASGEGFPTQSPSLTPRRARGESSERL
jgi:hypothetical protein